MEKINQNNKNNDYIINNNSITFKSNYNKKFDNNILQ